MSAVRFDLLSRAIVGHANPHESGNVTLTFMGGPNLSVSFSIGGMATADARTLAAALTEAADRADALALEKANRK